MDANAFLTSTVQRIPTVGEWLFAGAKLLLGIALVSGVVPLVPSSWPTVRGWVGMAGLIFVLHFGSFHLLSCAWRSAGVEARPLMHWPILARSLTEFWGQRWNTAFRDLTHRFLFRPLASRLGPRVGLATGFLASGLVHDLVISVPAGGGYGLPTAYFVLQGVGLLVERSATRRAMEIGRRWPGRIFTALVVIGPACLLFSPIFVTRVVLPFLAALGVG